VRSVFGTDAAVVTKPAPLAGGTMHPSFAIDVQRGGERLELVVRTFIKGRGDPSSAAHEFETIRASKNRGVRAPEVYGHGEAASGDAYIVMARVPGETSPRPLLQHPDYGPARAVVVQQLASALAGIHDASEALQPGSLRKAEEGQDPLLAECLRLGEQYQLDRLERHPVLEWTLRWMAARARELPPPAQADALVHGDFRVGNIMYDAEGLKAVLDWEAVHFGDPVEDLAWFCTWVWRFGRPDLEAGGLASRDEWIAAYERASSRTVDRDRMALWEVAANMKWAIVTLNQAKAHISGTVRSHELLAIGRRTAETELEILRLVQGIRGSGDAG
jgi:aminoglycoside phosphotransferase (APT) family kinase protein